MLNKRILLILLCAYISPLNAATCKSGIYSYVPEILNEKGKNLNIKMELRLGHAVPDSLQTVAREKLGPVKYSFRITSARNDTVTSIELFEACSQMGMVTCALDDTNEFKARGVADELGYFKAIKVFNKNGALTTHNTDPSEAPEYIFFDDSAGYYFYRGSGKSIGSHSIQLIDDEPTKLVNMYSWQLQGCAF